MLDKSLEEFLVDSSTTRPISDNLLLSGLKCAFAHARRTVFLEYQNMAKKKAKKKGKKKGAKKARKG